jgi:hypothetical protein
MLLDVGVGIHYFADDVVGPAETPLPMTTRIDDGLAHSNSGFPATKRQWSEPE